MKLRESQYVQQYIHNIDGVYISKSLKDISSSWSTKQRKVVYLSTVNAGTQ